MPGAPVMPPDGFRITQQVPGGEPVDLTKVARSVSWFSNVPGGFGQASLTIPRLLSQKERGLLGGLTIEYDGRSLFEGRVEDAFFAGDRTSVSTELRAFGLQRLLAANSVRKIWSLRSSLSPVAVSSAKGSISSGALTLCSVTSYVIGLFDTGVAGAPRAFGADIKAGTPTTLANECAQISIALPTGLTGARVMFDAVIAGGNHAVLTVHSSADGVNYTEHVEQGPPVTSLAFSVDTALVDGATDIRISAAAIAVAGQVEAQVSNLRVLGTGLREDTAGGWYGGTILRDVVAGVPGLYPGKVEDGSEFVIAEVQRVTRSSVQSVVDEISPLYNREWAVWEAGRFDWITPDLSSGGWVIPLTRATAWNIETSLDGVSNRTYVTFTDAADNLIKEASADATSVRNPFVRTGVVNDVVVPAVAAMTSVSAPFLAAKLSADTGRWPDVRGSLSVLAQTLVSQAGNGSRVIPAFAIRAGDNVTIPDLPVEDIYASGQDGQTVFHVTGVQATTDGSVTLTLEGLTRRTDVLLARLSQ